MNKIFVILAIATTVFVSACSNNSGSTMVTPEAISEKL
jgi:ABC-type Fe3+-hydroxamate transport system substrate-binding protein